MPQQRVRRQRTTRRRRHKGGLFPLLALLLAAIAAGKAAALGAVSGAAGYGTKKALEAATKKWYNASRVERAAMKRRRSGLVRHPDGSTFSWTR